LILFAFVVSLVSEGTAKLSAQAVPIREKKAELTTFATYTHLTPDYGPQNNSGVSFGIDYARYLKFVTPALEFRVKIANGETVDQKTYGGGIRVEHQWDRFHPYGMFLISAGYINYHFRTPPIMSNGKPYLSDSSVVYGYGGGLDFDVTQNFSARGEFQAENWNLGGYTPITLAPSMWSLGVVYRIPFRPYGGR
jgi:opacity protein-like surface antigen